MFLAADPKEFDVDVPPIFKNADLIDAYLKL
jgi:hypothetical protein